MFLGVIFSLVFSMFPENFFKLVSKYGASADDLYNRYRWTAHRQPPPQFFSIYQRLFFSHLNEWFKEGWKKNIPTGMNSATPT